MKKEQEKQDEIESSNAPLIEHLSELRSRLVVSVLSVSFLHGLRVPVFKVYI